MRIPIQSLTSVRQSGGPAIPAGAFQQTAQAASNLLGAYAGAAETINKHFAEAQDLKNRSEISEKNREIRDAQAIFQNELIEGNIDPTEWGPRWQARLKQVESSLGLQSSKIAPAVKRAVGENFKTFAGQSFIQISGAALKENRKRARQNFDRDLQDFYAVGDIAGAQQLIKDSTGTVLDEEEAADMARTTTRIGQKLDREFALNADPKEYAEGIRAGKYGDMSPLQEQQELDKAQRKSDQLEGQGLADIREMQAGGLIENEEDLERELNANPYISDNAKAAYLKNFQDSQPLSNAEYYDLQDAIDTNVSNFEKGKITAEEYEAEWLRLNSQVETYGSRGRTGGFRSDLHNLRPSVLDPNGGGEEAARQRLKDLKPIQTTANALIKERADGMANIAYIEQRNGDDDLGTEDLASNAALKQEIAEHGVLVRSALQVEMQSFIQGFDGKPTEGDIKKWLDDNQDRISRKVLDDRATRDSGLLPPIDSTPAERADRWLNPANALLLPLDPPAQKANEGNPGDFIFKEEGGVGTTGKGDKYGQVSEIYGMNKKADGANYTRVKALHDSGDEAGAKRMALNILSSAAARDGLKSSNPKIQEILVGIHHHRGGRGSREILQAVTGTQLTGNALVAKFEEVAKKPGFADEWIHARKEHERANYGDTRPQFKALHARWRREAKFLAS